MSSMVMDNGDSERKTTPAFNPMPLRSRSLGPQRHDDETSANPSLHYLITRARRRGNNERGSYSANASPNAPHQRRVVSLSFNDLEQPQQRKEEVDKAWEQLSSYPESWLPSDDEEEQDEHNSKDMTRDLQQEQPKRGAFPTAEASRHSFDAPPHIAAVSAHSSRSDSWFAATTSSGSSDSSSRISQGNFQGGAAASVVEHASPLRLPDPSSVEDRGTLFAVSRKMCSCSSIESFGGGDDDDESFDDEEAAVHHQDQGAIMVRQDTNPAQQESGGEHTCAGMMENDASVSTHSMLSSEDGHDGDDDHSLDSGPLHRQGRAHHGRQELYPDDDTIAFSMDSVNVRKQQFDSSQYTDWAVDDPHHQSQRSDCTFALEDHDDGDHHQPLQQVVYEFDMTSLDNSMSHCRLQQQAELKEECESEDDDSSSATMSSIRAGPSGRMMQLVDDMNME